MNPHERVAVTITGDALRVINAALVEVAGTNERLASDSPVGSFGHRHFATRARTLRLLAAECAAVHRGDADHLGDALRQARQEDVAAATAEIARREGRQP